MVGIELGAWFSVMKRQKNYFNTKPTYFSTDIRYVMTPVGSTVLPERRVSHTYLPLSASLYLSPPIYLPARVSQAHT